MKNPLFTIGHSTHSPEAFLGLLQRHGITAIADVRSHPYSRRLPEFGRERLRDLLLPAGIRYVFMGDALGARPADRSMYRGGTVDFDALAAGTAFRDALSRLDEGSDRFRICLLCAEKEPSDCHRAIIVGNAAHEAGACVTHILADGSLEPHDALLARIAGVEPSLGDLFGTADKTMLALARRVRQIAYTLDEEDEN